MCWVVPSCCAIVMGTLSERPAIWHDPARPEPFSRWLAHRRRLLTACCLSDVLRIFAPESPYENDTLKVC